MGRARSKFWDDLNDDMQDPEYRVAFEDEVTRIKAHDRILNTLNEAIVASGMTKRELARRVGMNESSLRRLLSARQNTTIKTLEPLALELGFELALVPRGTTGSRDRSRISA